MPDGFISAAAYKTRAADCGSPRRIKGINMWKREHRNTSGSLNRHRGQSTIEFTFGMVILGLIIYGLVQCFRWVMLDLTERRVDHERVLTLQGVNPATGAQYTTEDQLNPNFHSIRKIDAVLPAQ